MRGKHGNAARGRRDRAELEQRALKAEHRSGRLEKELNELRQSGQREIEALRSKLSQAIKDRDHAAAPALMQAEAQIRSLMQERDRAVKDRESMQKKWNAAASNVVEILAGMGLTRTEAMETLFTAIEPDGRTRTVNFSGRSAPPDQLVAIDRANGHRRASDPLADRRITTD